MILCILDNYGYIAQDRQFITQSISTTFCWGLGIYYQINNENRPHKFYVMFVCILMVIILLQICIVNKPATLQGRLY